MMQKQINQTTEQLVFFLMFQKYMKDAFIVNYSITLIKIFFQKFFFSKYHCGFRKGFCAQGFNASDNKEFCAAILIDLSKAFDCIYHFISFQN